MPQPADHPASTTQGPTEREPVMSPMPQSTLVSSTFQVNGMTCGHCEQAVSSEICKIPAVTDVSVNLPTGQVTVASDQPVDPAAVRRALEEAGYDLA